MPLPIKGLYETHLTVRNLQHSIQFYRDLLGLNLAREITPPGIAFFWLGEAGSSMLGLWEIAASPLQQIGHFAFRVRLADIMQAVGKLQAANIQPLGFHGEPVDEPIVIGWMPAVSVYFRDPDGNSLEYLSMLDANGDINDGILPLSEWIKRHGEAKEKFAW